MATKTIKTTWVTKTITVTRITIVARGYNNYNNQKVYNDFKSLLDI